MYHVCDTTRETQADELVRHIVAPMYDKMVAEGKLVSWGWWQHIMGGKYRRLETFTANNVRELVAARAALNEALEKDPLGDALNAICDSHQDYIWDTKMQNS